MLSAIGLITAVPIFPAFFLGPLLLWLLLSRPRTARELMWVAVSVGALVAWFRLPNTISQQVIQGAAVCFVGALVALTLSGVRALVHRALLALAIAAIAMCFWGAAYHLSYQAVTGEVTASAWEAWRQVQPSLPANPGTTSVIDLASPTDAARRLAASVALMGRLYASMVALLALGASWLAWYWYQRIARHPLSPPAQPVWNFRFNDQLVWALVLAGGARLFPLSDNARLVTDNVLVVVLALYWLRGVAVTLFTLRRASGFMLLLLALLVIPMFAFALAALTLLGVADTWVDFRRRSVTPKGAVT